MAACHALDVEIDDPRVRKTARQMLRNYGTFLADFVRLSHAAIERRLAQGDISFCGYDHFSAAVASGRPLLFVGLHLGNWALGLDILASRLGRPIHIFASAFGTEALRCYLNRRQHWSGSHVIIGNGLRGTLHALHSLRKGNAAVLLIDAPEDTRTNVVTFLGKKAQMSSLPGYLAYKTGALILPSGIVHTGRNHWLGFVEAPIGISNPTPGDYSSVTQYIARSLERWVRLYPAQWFMFHSIWQPAGEHLKPDAGQQNRIV